MRVDGELVVGLEVPDTDCEGPHRRYAVWLQGCPLRCPGCCNPELLPFDLGTPVRVADLLRRILDTPGIDGISLIGGEPFAQAKDASILAEGARQHRLSVVVFSGFTLAEIERQGDDALRLLAATDLLIDGRFEEGNPDSERRWVGSTNQKVHFLSDRFDANDAVFREPGGLEIRFDANGLTINGRPWGTGLP